MFRSTKKILIALACLSGVVSANSQTGLIRGKVIANGAPVVGANIILHSNHHGTVADSLGEFAFSFVSTGKHLVRVSAIGFEPIEQRILLSNDTIDLKFLLSFNRHH